MMTGIYSIGISGLAAAQLGLLATEHNVVNANTPGYSRQRTVQNTNTSINTGAGSIGQGVRVTTIERMYDRFLTGQVKSADAKVSELDAFYGQIKQIDDMLADPNAGLSPALQDFFSGVQSVAASPSSLPARQSMISSAETLATRFHMIDDRLTELAGQVNGRITDAVSQANSYATQIANVNQQIVVSESGYGQPANDLLDFRDNLIGELNKLISVTTTTNTDGSYNVFIGTGQQLVVGSNVMELTATASSADSSKIVLGLKTPGGNQEIPESLITGGQLGGLVSFRNQSLDSVTNKLGLVATSLAVTFNAQHALGQDLRGNIAGDIGFVGELFTLSAPLVSASSKNTGLGAMSAVLQPPVAPTSPDFSGNFYTDLTSSNYQVQFGAAGSYSITRVDDKQIVAAGSGAGAVSFDGVTLTISAVGNSGDKFLVKPVNEGGRNIDIDERITADPRLIAAAAPMRVTQSLINAGTMSLSQGVVGVGYDVSGLPLTLTAAAATAPATGVALSGIPAAWTAVYSNGTSVSGVGGEINLTSGTETLATISFAGMSFGVKGSPAFGDQFSLQRNTGGVEDGRNAILFAKLQTQNTVAGGKASFQSAYAGVVADNAIRTRESKIQLEAQTVLLSQAQSARDSLSGVNLDEEAANMLKFQQAYQASSKILQIGNTLFDTILSLG
jgi:flagellar hook-associated protein 1